METQPTVTSAPLCDVIQKAADGRLGFAAFIAALHAAYEQAEEKGPIQYRSKEEGRLIWDMLWAVEFYSPDPAREARPEEWNDDRVLAAEIQRVAGRVARLEAAPKHAGDPRFATYPAETGIAQMRWYIRQAAGGIISIQEFLADFRDLHEHIEQVQRPAYASKEEARAIWDVLWAVEYCSLDVANEETPEEWLVPEEVLKVVRQAAPKLST